MKLNNPWNTPFSRFKPIYGPVRKLTLLILRNLIWFCSKIVSVTCSHEVWLVTEAGRSGLALFIKTIY